MAPGVGQTPVSGLRGIRVGHKVLRVTTGPLRDTALYALCWVGVPTAAATMIAALVLRAGSAPVFGLLLGLTAVAAMAARPQTATIVTAFLLYANVPAVMTRHGLPDAAAGAFILLLALPIAHSFVVRRELLRFDATLGLMFGLLAVALLSTLRAVDPGIALTWVGGYLAEGLLLYWLVVNAVRNLESLRAFFWTLLATAALLTTLCLYQDVTGRYDQVFGGLAAREYQTVDDAAAVSFGRTERGESRAQGPVDEPNRFAQIMLVLVPLAGYLYRTARSKKAAAWAAALGLMTLVGVILTLSRGGFVTLALVFVAMAAVKWIRPVHVVTGAVVVAVLAMAVSPQFVSRLTSILDARHLVGGSDFGYQEADGAIRGRTTEMLAALHVFRDHPVLGVGPGQFTPFYFVPYSKSSSVKFRELNVPRRAHNLFLELAAEQGALGLGVFVAIVGLLMRWLWRARLAVAARDAGAADLASAVWLSLLAYLGSGMFLHLSYQRYFWLLLALASAALHVVRALPPLPVRGTTVQAVGARTPTVLGEAYR